MQVSFRPDLCWIFITSGCILQSLRIKGFIQNT